MNSYLYPVEIWKLDDQSIITLGGEVVVEYANALKRIFRTRHFCFRLF